VSGMVLFTGLTKTLKFGNDCRKPDSHVGFDTQSVTIFRFLVAACIENPASHIRCGKRKESENRKFIQ
jgi:hypothetical protein